MRRKALLGIGCAALLLGMLGQGRTRSEDGAPEVPTGTAPLAPYRVESGKAPAPVTMMAGDALRLLEAIRPAAATDQGEEDAPDPAGPPSRTIYVEPAGPVVNTTDRFAFRPLRRTSAPASRILPSEQRRAIVERLRRQLERERAGGRQP